MPKINVKEPFDFAENGNKVVTIKEGEQEVSERCALVAIEHLGVAEPVKGKKTPAKKKQSDDK